MRPILATTLVALVTLAGCSATTSDRYAEAEAVGLATMSLSKNPSAAYTFPADQYPDVHAATIEVLRYYGFRIARNDYRFGSITTYPKESPTFAEFWIDDATTRDQRRSDTLNAHQRTVSISIKRAEVSQELNTETGEVAPPGYILTAEVQVQRRQEPSRYLTHSATGVLSAEYDAPPRHLSNQGIDGPYALQLTRDPQLERRLIAAIQAEASE